MHKGISKLQFPSSSSLFPDILLDSMDGNSTGLHDITSFKKVTMKLQFKVINWRHGLNYSAAVGTSWNYVIMIARNG
jgi:hypothetical protein